MSDTLQSRLATRFAALNARKPVQDTYLSPTKATPCAHCGEPLGSSGANYLSDQSGPFHDKCYRRIKGT